MARQEKRRRLLSLMPKGAVCAEIGVWDGGFSEEILRITQPRELHLIDPWEFQPEFNNSAFGRENHRDAMGGKYRMVCRKFRHDGRVRIHRAMSDAALATFDDAALDWVYIDGNHNFEVVSNDLRLCLKKVRPNGVISGDDLLWKMNEGAPVRRAVRAVTRELEGRHEFTKIGQQWIIWLNRDPDAPRTGTQTEEFA